MKVKFWPISKTVHSPTPDESKFVVELLIEFQSSSVPSDDKIIMTMDVSKIGVSFIVELDESMLPILGTHRKFGTVRSGSVNAGMEQLKAAGKH